MLHSSSFSHISHLQFSDKAGSHSEKLYKYCSTSTPDLQVSKWLEVSALVQQIRWLTMSSGMVIGIPALPPTLMAKSSSTQDSSCRLWDRTYMRMTTVMVMVMVKVARTLSAQAGTRP